MQADYRARARDPLRRTITNKEVGNVRFEHVRPGKANGNTATA
jgi:hypothetical protein